MDKPFQDKGQGESGFRASTYVVGSDNQPKVPTDANTGKSKLTFEAPTPEKLESIKEGLKKNTVQPTNLNVNNVTAVGGGDASNVIVQGTGGTPTTLEFEILSNQHVGEETNPTGIGSVMRKGRLDYPLSPEDVKKLEAEAPLWKGKLKPDGSKVSTNAGEQYGNTGGYEFLATEIYKLGYEQGVDRVYIPNIKQRIALTEAAKAAGWDVKSITPTNLPPGLIYDEKTDTIQGRVVAPVQNGVYDLRLTVDAENKTTNQTAKVTLADLRVGWIGWQDTKPPKIEVSKDAYETEVGKDVDIDITYSDEAGSNFSGDRRKVNYKLADGRIVEIPNQKFRQAVSGLAGNPTTKTDGPGRTSIPGLTYDLSKDGTPVVDENGDQKIYGKGKLSGQPTRAGVYTVGVYAKDYNSKTTGETPWIQSGHEVQEYMTVVVKPKVTVKNVHAYSTNIPVEISEGASTAEVTLPNGKVTKLEAKNGKWVVAEGTTNKKAAVGTELGDVGEEINIPVSQEDTATAATDTITAKATTENVQATLLRNKIELTDAAGVKHTATLSKESGHWELDAAYKEVKTPKADGGYTLTKRQVYTEVQTDGSVNYYIYSYTRTYNAQDEVVSVDDVTRDKTVVPRQNTEDQQGATTVVEYDANTKEWKASDGSKVTATKEGDFWKVETTSGFTGLIKGSKAEKTDLGSVINDAPTATSTSYTSVKGATVDLVKQASAAVTIKDTEDDSTTDPKKETTVTKVTLTSPSGKVTEFASAEAAKAAKLTEVGVYTVKVEVKDSNGNIVTANDDTETGTDKGADTAVASTTYTITVKDQPTDKVYVVEDETVTNDQLKEKVVPTEVDGFTATKNNIADIPTTAKKAGQTLEVPATVNYTKGTEAIPVETKVDVVVLPKVEPTGVTVLKDSTGLDEAVKAKAVEAANAVPTDKLPDGVTVRVKEVKAGTVPATTATGVQTPATAVVEYVKDGKVVATREVTVPVTVVGSTAKKLVVFEGDTVTKDDVKGAVTPGTDGTKGEPVIADDITAKAGNKEATVPVTYDGIKDPENVTVPVTVLPVAKDEVTVSKGTSVDKLKEVTKAKAEEVVNSADFKAQLPNDAQIKGVGAITEEVLATITANKGDNQGTVKVPVTYVVDGVEYTKAAEITVNVKASEVKPIYVAEGEKPEVDKVKSAVTPGDGGTVQDPKESDLPDTTGKAGNPNVVVPTTIKYPNGEETVEVPVKVVKGNPQIIPVDQGQPLPENSVNTEDYPEGATFEYEKVAGKDPVNISEAGDYPVNVIVKDKEGNKLVTVPTTVRVVDAYRQYVPVNTDPTKVVPAENIVPTDFPDGTTFEYKTPVDTSTPGDKDVVVVAKLNNEPIAEIPAKVTVVGPNTQYVAANPENNQPDPAKSLTDKDNNKFPDKAKFEYKTPVDTTTPGEKDATVVVKDADDDTIVEVPAKVKVVQGNPQIIPVDQGQPLAENSINKGDYPEGATFEYEKVDGKDPVDISEVGDYPVNVIVKDKDGNKLVEVPTTVRVVGAYRQYVPVDTKPETILAKENIDPEDFPEGTTFEYKDKDNNPVNTKTTGDKDVVVVAKLNGEPIAEIPAKVTVVGPKTQYVAVGNEPDVNKSVDPSVFPKEAVAKPEYKEKDISKTPGIKDVTVVVKDGDGDSIVEVPAKVIVVQGKEQEVTVNPDKAPEAKDNINPKDFPEGATFTFKEQPDTTTPGKKNVIVVVRDKDGNLLVEVPAVVNVVERKEEPQTPKESVTVTPIVVEVGTPITTEDVKGHVKLPKDAEIIEVDEIPTTETPGVKPSVKVKVKLPTGEIVVVEVPVTVIPKRIPETNPYNGDGYNGGGNGGSNYRPTPQPVPSTPETPEQPVAPVQPEQPTTPTQPAVPTPAETSVPTDSATQPATPKYVEGQKELPNTGTEANASLAALGLLGALSGFGLLSRKKKED